MSKGTDIGLQSEAPLIIKCDDHGLEKKPWVVCVHVPESTPRVARRIDDQQIAGEVLCESCFDACNAAAERDEPAPTEHLRLACEACVLERYKLTTSN